jgi:flagellar operon protein
VSEMGNLSMANRVSGPARGARSSGASGLDTIAPKKPGAEALLAKEFKGALDQATLASMLTPESAPGSAAGIQSSAVAGLAKSADAGLKFSAHAVERMRTRGINFPPDSMKKIEEAVAKAAGKGAKDTLVIAGEQALIVSVKNNTVVTVMDRASMRENVFTNIDSTVVI